MEQSFYERVYKIASKIPKGKVTTYREIARKLKSRAYQAVGTAMNKNPYSVKKKNQIYVACHRVVNSNGRVGGFASETKNKVKMLKREGVEVVDGKVDLKIYGWKNF